MFDVVGGRDEVAVAADPGGVEQVFFDGEHLRAFGASGERVMANNLDESVAASRTRPEEQ